MERMGLYEIRDRALASGSAVFSVAQLANLIGKPKAVAAVYSSRLVRKVLARRLLRGKISFVDDDFVIAAQLLTPSYISLSSALLFHEFVQQVPSQVECVTTVNRRDYPKLGISYHKIPPSLFFGYAKYDKSGSYTFVAEPEKAVIDAVYLNRFPDSSLNEILPRLDAGKLEEHIRRFKGRGRKKLERWLL
ncbi:MAG: hypothetical protein PHF51_03865 [Candidatus ainarchaeum sp.]|nr:hypothetical protein [Candidatus ainarchaeum sp.]